MTMPLTTPTTDTLPLLTQGKGKTLYTHPSHPELVLMSFGDQLTAFNGQKKEVRPGKGAVTASLTRTLMSYLAWQGVPTACLTPQQAHSLGLPATEPHQLWAKRLTMLPLEVVVRNQAMGSLTKRLPFLEQGHVFAQPLVEFCYKSDAHGDPVVTDDVIEAMGWLPAGVTLKQIKTLALNVNAALLALAKQAQLTLPDFKIEVGVLPDGTLCLGDELSGDSCRFRDVLSGQVLDKDVFRLDLGDVLEAYHQLESRLQNASDYLHHIAPQAASVTTPAQAKSYTLHVHVAYKPNVLHPESRTVLQTLNSMGYTQISQLSVGKLITLTLSSQNQQAALELANQLANTVLSNPIIETFTTTLIDDSLID